MNFLGDIYHYYYVSLYCTLIHVDIYGSINMFVMIYRFTQLQLCASFKVPPLFSLFFFSHIDRCFSAASQLKSVEPKTHCFAFKKVWIGTSLSNATAVQFSIVLYKRGTQLHLSLASVLFSMPLRSRLSV